MPAWSQPTPRRKAPTLVCAALLAGVLALVGVNLALAKPAKRVVGIGQIRYAGKGPEAWHWRYVQQRARAADLQHRLTRRVLEAQGLRRTLLHRPSSLEALRLASVVYRVPFSLLYRRASCESTGSQPVTPPSGRTLSAGAYNNGSAASGLFQFLPSTYNSTPFAGFDVFSPYANAFAGAWMMGPAGRGSEWSCR